MKKFVLRHWRGNGQIIPDIMRDKYYDYPKHRNKRPYSLSQCIVQVISQKEYMEEVLNMWGKEALDQKIKKYHLNNN